ncbi:MAG: DNA-3-methyladenine glycosylase 2 family protein [Synergistetes bacterium HGW-Synergistetes-1]|jgi:3-methyladenine DNA glycosylase/8-oxoguanine DNA glycosylase|nr:MAG: DNA-3-methyladenine glycosylase 2 family protein [Synergistetes bacterium HGW-Synergistetes-1]
MPVLEYGERELFFLSRKDKKLGKLIENTGYLKCEVSEDLFDSLVGYIATQQISNRAAETVRMRITQKFGIVTPEKTAFLPDEEIKSVGISMKKAQYIKGLSEAVLSGALDIEGLADLPDKDVASRLTSIKGIGDWTAEMFLIFSLGRMNILSYKDFAIRKGMMSLYGLKDIERGTFEKYRKRYSPYGTIASLYLWHLSENVH